MKIIPCLPALLSLLAPASTHATVTEQQWGEWYGNTGGMEFALSSDNQAGEKLTISCSNKRWLWSGRSRRRITAPPLMKE